MFKTIPAPQASPSAPSEPRLPELGEVAIGITCTSLGYGALAYILSLIALFVVTGVLDIDLGDRQEDAWFHGFTAVIWMLFMARLLWQIRQAAKAGLKLSSSMRKLHYLEYSICGFLLLFSLALPYLTESDASGYSTLQIGFNLLLGVCVLWHVILLALFKAKPTRFDVISIATTVLTPVFLLFG